MAKDWKLPKGIHSVYKSSFFETLILGYMDALHLYGNKTQEQAAQIFQQRIGIDEDQASTKSLVCIYQRKRSEFLDAMRGEPTQIKFHDLEMRDARLLQIIKKAVEIYDEDKK